MKPKIIIAVILILLYLPLINFISYIMEIQILQNNETLSALESGKDQAVGLGDSVTIGVKRNKLYGNIIGPDDDTTLNLFNFIKVPMRRNGINYKWIHISFLTSLILTLIILTIVEGRWKRNEVVL